MRRTSRLTIPAVALAAGLMMAPGPVYTQAGYVPLRVYVSQTKQFADLETLAAVATKADVVFVGEQHDDVNTHRLERMLLEALKRRRGDVVLALEMFERDVQEPLAHFSMGHMDEAEFLAQARPWPQYARDYKPLVDFAIANDWSVVASNVPRDIAAAVSKSGLDALKTRPEAERAWFARDLQCAPEGRYFTRFREAMTGHDKSGPSFDAATMGSYYASQCLKDETMAESIAQAYAAGSIGGKRPLVVSINGTFHSDYGGGTVERTRRRLPGKRVIVVTMIPVGDLDTIKPDKDTRERGDYLVYTVADRKTGSPR
ncbi:MAG: ChaN family lipoprotein [Acidobacteriota bacterium]